MENTVFSVVTQCSSEKFLLSYTLALKMEEVCSPKRQNFSNFFDVTAQKTIFFAHFKSNIEDDLRELEMKRWR
jgi:uncharacterized FlgJ-related protein